MEHGGRGWPSNQIRSYIEQKRNCESKIDYSLGEHTFTIEKDNEILASRIFAIDTNLKDMEKVATLLYQQGHINNRGVYLAVLLHIKGAQLYEKLGWIGSRNRILKHLITYVLIQGKGKNARIDAYGRKVLVGGIERIISNY